MDPYNPLAGLKKRQEADYLSALDRHREAVTALALKLNSASGEYDPTDDAEIRAHQLRQMSEVLTELVQEDATLAAWEDRGAAFIYDLE